MDDVAIEVVGQSSSNDTETTNVNAIVPDVPIWIEVIERLLAAKEYVDMDTIFAGIDNTFEDLDIRDIIIGNFINEVINDMDQYLQQSDKQDGVNSRDIIITAINNLPSVKELDKKRRVRLV